MRYKRCITRFWSNKVHLCSTRDRNVTANYEEAIFSGLAPDGGLYQLCDPPNLRPAFHAFDSDSNFLDVAARLSSELLSDELGDATGDICKRAFTFTPKITFLEPGIDLLELYHGPSHAFKDFGASFLASSMSYLLRKSGRTAVILTATSGDTGSAVAQAFYGTTGIEVVILYPSGRVSPLQEKQLTTVGGNVHALEVEGAFDDCQRMVKEAFLDPELRSKLPLTSANSISIGRLLPQAFYYAFAASRRDAAPEGEDGGFRFCVPSGNFGNLTAGTMGWQWGMPCGGFIAATNVNDVVPEYLETAVFFPRPSVHTLSNAMDVGNPSNFERLLAIFDGDHAEVSRVVEGMVVTDDETLEEIRNVYERAGRFICPHTAVGTLAARRFREKNPEVPIVTLATAHPAKFGDVIEQATGKTPELPSRLAEALARRKEATKIGKTLEDLRRYLLSVAK